ncbi:MAG: head-tail adaptor protein [Firmicutes bacterium]|nr:head-tail adaptor protein [Bacillota bacterium]
MSIGDLRHKIIFQKLFSSINQNGFEIENWQQVKSVWSSVKNLHGKEYFEAAKVQREKTVKFIIRFNSEIDETMRIVFKGKYYNITSIDNIKYENKYIEIKAMEVDSNG